MLKLVGDDVPSIEQFMNRYRVKSPLSLMICKQSAERLTRTSKMDHPAALQRLKVGVPATVEHSSEAGPETGKWVAETTQVSNHDNILWRSLMLCSAFIELHHFYGCT